MWWIGSFNDSSQPMNDAIERIYAVSPPRLSIGSVRWYWR